MTRGKREISKHHEQLRSAHSTNPARPKRAVSRRRRTLFSTASLPRSPRHDTYLDSQTLAENPCTRRNGYSHDRRCKTNPQRRSMANAHRTRKRSSHRPPLPSPRAHPRPHTTRQHSQAHAQPQDRRMQSPPSLFVESSSLYANSFEYFSTVYTTIPDQELHT